MRMLLTPYVPNVEVLAACMSFRGSRPSDFGYPRAKAQRRQVRKENATLLSDRIIRPLRRSVFAENIPDLWWPLRCHNRETVSVIAFLPRIGKEIVGRQSKIQNLKSKMESFVDSERDSE